MQRDNWQSYNKIRSDTMTTYHADTGMHVYTFKADSDFAACEMYPDAMLSRADGKMMDEKECEEAFKMNE